MSRKISDIYEDNMNNLSTVSFRASVPAATPANTPVTVSLEPIGSALQKMVIFAGSGSPDMTKTGFRVRNHGVLILPDNGSSEAGITLGAGEAGWAALIAHPVEIFFSGRLLEGPPFNVALDFYNVSASPYFACGFVHSCQPELGIPDLIRELKRWQEAKPLPVEYDKAINVDPKGKSGTPPYPEMTRTRTK